MIINFYKMTRSGNLHSPTLLVSRNIECIPPLIKTVIIYNGQKFCIDRLEFDLNKCEYNAYMIRL